MELRVSQSTYLKKNTRNRRVKNYLNAWKYELHRENEFNLRCRKSTQDSGRNKYLMKESLNVGLSQYKMHVNKIMIYVEILLT